MIGNRIAFFVMVFLLAGAALVWANELGPVADRSGVSGVTCSTSGCHDFLPVNAGTGSVSISGLPSEWSPSVTYPLQVTVEDGGASRFGFQLTAVDSNVAQAGTFTAGSGTAVVNGSVGANTLQHMQHSFPQPGGGTATFGFDWTAPATSATGAVRFNVAGNAADGSFSSSGDFIYSAEVSISPATDDDSDTRTSYFPQIADGTFGGGFFKTTLFVTNPASEGTADITITFTGRTGGAFNVSFIDSAGQPAGSGNVVSISGLGAGETRKLTSTAAAGLAVGYATLTADADVEATAVFSQFSGTVEQGTLLSEAAVTLSDPSADQRIFVDESSGFRTALAYANPSSTAEANLTFSLHDTNTGGVPVVTKALDPVPTLNQSSLFVDELFSTAGVTDPLVEGIVGTLRIESDTPVAVVSLRFLGDLFTSVPPFSAASLVFPEKYFAAPIRLVAGHESASVDPQRRVEN